VGAVALAVFAVATMYLGGGGGVSQYHATAKVLAGVPGDGPREDTELERLDSDAVVSAATARLGRAPSVAVSQTGADIYAITGTGGADVVKDVNTYAESFVEIRRKELMELYDNRAGALRARMAEVEKAGVGSTDPAMAGRQLEALAEELDKVTVDAATIDNSVRVFAPARSASVDAPRSKKVTTVASLVLALLAGLLAPFVYDLIRGRVNTAGDVQRLVPGLRVLGTTARAVDDPAGSADVGLLVRLAVHAAHPQGTGSLALAPAGSEPGPAALADEIARQLSAVLLDASPDATPEERTGQPTLAQVLAGGGPGSPEAAGDPRPPRIRMGAGDLAILRDTRFADVLGDLRKQHPYVVVLAPSAASPDGVAVAAAAAYIVLSATAGHTKVRDLRDAVEQCEAVGSIVLGVVLFGVSGADARRA
jgi:hypothetical protein